MTKIVAPPRCYCTLAYSLLMHCYTALRITWSLNVQSYVKRANAFTIIVAFEEQFLITCLFLLNIFSKSWKCSFDFRTAFPFWWHERETPSGQSLCCRSRFIKRPDPAAQDDGGEKNQSDGGEEGKWRGTELTALVSSLSGRSSKVSTTLIPSSSTSSSLTSVTSAGHSVWNPLIPFLSLWVFCFVF